MPRRRGGPDERRTALARRSPALAAAALLAAAPAAYAFWTNGVGHGDGHGGGVAAAGHASSPAPHATQALYPTGQPMGDVAVAVTNPNAYGVHVANARPRHRRRAAAASRPTPPAAASPSPRVGPAGTSRPARPCSSTCATRWRWRRAAPALLPGARGARLREGGAMIRRTAILMLAVFAAAARCRRRRGRLLVGVGAGQGVAATGSVARRNRRRHLRPRHRRVDRRSPSRGRRSSDRGPATYVVDAPRASTTVVCTTTAATCTASGLPDGPATYTVKAEVNGWVGASSTLTPAIKVASDAPTTPAPRAPRRSIPVSSVAPTITSGPARGRRRRPPSFTFTHPAVQQRSGASSTARGRRLHRLGRVRGPRHRHATPSGCRPPTPTASLTAGDDAWTWTIA